MTQNLRRRSRDEERCLFKHACVYQLEADHDAAASGFSLLIIYSPLRTCILAVLDRLSLPERSLKVFWLGMKDGGSCLTAQGTSSHAGLKPVIS